MDFGRKMANEKELPKHDKLRLSEAIFDQSGKFFLYSTLWGVRVISLRTGACIKIIGLTGTVSRTLPILFLEDKIFWSWNKRPFDHLVWHCVRAHWRRTSGRRRLLSTWKQRRTQPSQKMWKVRFWPVFFENKYFQIRRFLSLLTKAKDFTFSPSENSTEKLMRGIFSMKSRLKRKPWLLHRFVFFLYYSLSFLKDRTSEKISDKSLSANFDGRYLH